MKFKELLNKEISEVTTSGDIASTMSYVGDTIPSTAASKYIRDNVSDEILMNIGGHLKKMSKEEYQKAVDNCFIEKKDAEDFNNILKKLKSAEISLKESRTQVNIRHMNDVIKDLEKAPRNSKKEDVLVDKLIALKDRFDLSWDKFSLSKDDISTVYQALQRSAPDNITQEFEKELKISNVHKL